MESRFRWCIAQIITLHGLSISNGKSAFKTATFYNDFISDLQIFIIVASIEHYQFISGIMFAFMCCQYSKLSQKLYEVCELKHIEEILAKEKNCFYAYPRIDVQTPGGTGDTGAPLLTMEILRIVAREKISLTSSSTRHPREAGTSSRLSRMSSLCGPRCQ